MRAPLVLGLVLTAACLQTAAVPEIPLRGTKWVLSSLSGQPPLARSRVTIEFETDSASGYGGCNWYGGPYRLSGRNLSFEEVGSTSRGCLSPSGVEEQERQYLEALRRIRGYRIDGDRLRLQDATGSSLLEFTRRVPFGMNPADLVGTSWTLRSLDGAAPIGTRPIRITFSTADTIRGFAGCRDFESKYSAEQDRIGVSETRMGATECHAGDAVLEQEGTFTTDLSEAEHYRLTPDRLEIFTAPGRVLVFDRRE